MLAFIHILAVKAIALHAGRAGTEERSKCVRAAGSWMASSILDLALINVYNLSKMGKCQAKKALKSVTSELKKVSTYWGKEDKE